MLANANGMITSNGHGISRAARTIDGNWTVEYLLADQDVRCLAADPLNPDVIYAGTQGRGVLRSSDRGLTWGPAGLAGQIVKAIAPSPHDPGTVYAGVKPPNVFITRDSGENWVELEGFRSIPNRWWWFSPAEPPGTAYVEDITISPTDPNVILAGIEFGAVVRSQDGGKTWSGHRSGALRDCHTLKFHPTDGNWAYEAGGTGGGVAISQDAGSNWQKHKGGLAVNYGVSCAADSERPDIWYASLAPSPGKAYSQPAQAYLYRSEAGKDWEPIGWDAHPMQSMPIALVTLPDDPGHLYAGSTNGEVHFSSDYGNTWEQMPVNLRSISRSLLIF